MTIRNLISLCLMSSILWNCSRKDPFSTWKNYRGDPGANCYSSLDQINRENVSLLEPAWIFHSGDAREGNRSTIECNPIIIDNIIYLTSPGLKLFALDAATGSQMWVFDPVKEGVQADVNRGITFWKKGKDRRIFFPASNRLYSINAEDGKPVVSFGKNGYIDLRDGLDRDPEKITAASSSPCVVYKDLIITGSKVSESYGAAPGHIRAFDAGTGKQVWIFHTIPHPGEYGYDSWKDPDAWKFIGGANCWAGPVVDQERGIVYCPTGSASPDFYGGNRKGNGLFADCLIALDARSGKRIWHFQAVHHNIWDYDLPSTPNLVAIRRNGKMEDAVAQITKMGHLFVFDRETGEPLFPVEEKPVPGSDIEGEESWPTQPFPSSPPAFVRQKYTDADLPVISQESRKFALAKLDSIRNEGIFTPLSLQGSLIFPGFRGGGEWSGAAFDFETGILYVNANEIPNLATIRKINDAVPGQEAPSPGRKIYELNCALCHGLNRKGQEVFPSLIDVEKRKSKFQMDSLIRNGKGQMPPFPQLDDNQRQEVIAYLTGTAQSSSADETAGKSTEEMRITTKFASSGYAQFLDEEGYPAVRPPWGTLNAIDLNKGEILWQKPLGEFQELKAKGIAPTGTQNFGGCLVTKGGLVFIGASADEKFRAFDKNTGEILWEYKLPYGGYATPATYEVDGVQYIVIAAGGGGKVGTKSGDVYITFRLSR